MAKTKQPAAALDNAKLQQLVQTLAQYGPFALAALQRLLDVLQSKQAPGTTPGAALGGGGGSGSDLLQRVRDHQVAALAELVLAGDYLDSQSEDGGEEGYAPTGKQAGQPGATGTTQGTTTPPK